MTSARLWTFQPSERSPRTALQAAALGSVLQTESGGSACADANTGKQKAKSSPREQNLSMRMIMGRLPGDFVCPVAVLISPSEAAVRAIGPPTRGEL